MEGRMSRFNRASKDKSDGKERNDRKGQRQKRKGAKNVCTACCSCKAHELLPLIGSRTAGKSAITTQTSKRKHSQPTALKNSFMTPWEGSSNSESSFASIIPPPPPTPPPSLPSPTSPKPHPPNTSSEICPNTPQAITAANTDSQQSARVKRRLLPFRGPSRPLRLPPLRQVTSLSFSRSFTFSFFELPWHQSMNNQAARLKELVVLLSKIKY